MLAIAICSGSSSAIGTVGSIESAAAVVATNDSKYFGFEAIQATSDSVSTLGSAGGLFQFYNEADTSSATVANERDCKVFPGDAALPSELSWESLNRALGNNALIKTIPLAAPCYDAWDYDQDECAGLTVNWTNSHLQ